MNTLSKEFIEFAIQTQVLKFGEFVTKAGRKSPYFFNAGLFNEGQSLATLSRYYAKTLLASGLQFDMLFGPAYKGITLAAATAVALAAEGKNIPFAYNRKEVKDHGEGGQLVGAAVRGKVVIIDDVISAGTSVRESVEMIRQAGAEPAAVLIALDRMERPGADDQLASHSAVQDVTNKYGIPVIAIANLNDLFSYLQENKDDPVFQNYGTAVAAYREKYGVK